MAVIVSMTPFVEWLQPLMEQRRLNQSQLATYIGTTSSAVNAWFTRGVIPSSAMCRKLATYFHVPLEEVLRAAGHLPALGEEKAEYDPPSWTALIPALTPGDAEYVGRLVESLARNPVHPPEPPAQEAP